MKDIFYTLGGKDPIELTQVFSGGNNKAFKVKAGDKTFFLKHYFSKERQERETLFLKHASGLSVPSLLFEGEGFNVLSYVEGESVLKCEKNHINQMLDFFNRLQKNVALPLASEARFGIKGYIERIETRLHQLNTLEDYDEIQSLCSKFIGQDVIPAWNKEKESLVKIDKFESLEEKVVSPSDFGLHNALSTKNGLVFFDFEHAGLDDPVKLILDFFYQPKVKIPEEYIPEVQTRILAKRDPSHLERLKLLFPVYRFIWIAIILGEFTKQASDRRSFAGASEDIRTKQLDKAQELLMNPIKIE